MIIYFFTQRCLTIGEVMSSRTSKFYLVGGLGNQLFGLCAGIAHSIILRKEVGFIVESPKVLSNSILSLNTNNYKFFEDKYGVSKWFFKLQMFNHVFRNEIYSSKQVGFDESILIENNYKVFRGYYQSYIYYQLISDSIKSRIFSLDKFSEWFLEMKRELFLTKPNIIHIRRGDYVNLKALHGLIGLKYYLQSMEIVESINPGKPFWIFSDDIDMAFKQYGKFFPKNSKWIYPPSQSNAVESLLLMSYGSTNIIANSTFSWWAATLNSNSKITVAPDKWFRGMADPEKLIPNHWLKVPSSWQD